MNWEINLKWNKYNAGIKCDEVSLKIITIYSHSIEHLEQLAHHFRWVVPMLLDQRKMFERHGKRYTFCRMRFRWLLYDDIAWIEKKKQFFRF